MIAFVFDRRSLILLAAGGLFLALVLVAFGFLLGIGFGVPGGAPGHSEVAQTALPASSGTAAGFSGGASEPASGAEALADLQSLDTSTDPADDAAADDTSDLVAAPEEGDPDSLPYTASPGGATSPMPPPRASASRWFPEAGSATPPAEPFKEAPQSEAPAGERDPLVPTAPLVPAPAESPASSSGESASVAAAAREDRIQEEAISPPPRIAPAAVQEGARYAVQVGAYRERGNCDAMVKKLAAHGFDAYVVELGRAGQSALLAVRIGRYPDRATAAKTASTLRAQAGVSAVVLAGGG